MRSKNLHVISVLCWFLSLFATHLYAQTNHAALFLLEPIVPRGSAMGESFVATSFGTQSMASNPAGLITHEQPLDFTYAHRNAFSGFNDGAFSQDYLAAVFMLSGYTAFGINYHYYSLGEQAMASEESPDVIGYFTPNESALAVSLAHEFVGGLQVGVTGKRIRTEWDDTHVASAWAGDAGVLYTIPGLINNDAVNSDLRFGLSLQNYGQKLGFFENQKDPLPQLLRVGTSFNAISTNRQTNNLPLYEFLFTFEYLKIVNDSDVHNLGFGSEVTFLGMGHIRFGYHRSQPQSSGFGSDDFRTGMAWGLGMTLPVQLVFPEYKNVKLSFDYGEAPFGGWQDSYEMFSMRLVYQR